MHNADLYADRTFVRHGSRTTITIVYKTCVFLSGNNLYQRGKYYSTIKHFQALAVECPGPIFRGRQLEKNTFELF